MTNEKKALSSEKRFGQYYTPTRLAEFLASRSVANLDESDADIVIIDPACGDGELLIAVYRALKANGWKNKLILRGFDIDINAVGIASRRLKESGIDADILHEDFLTYQRNIPSCSVDVIITNPPYVRTQNIGKDKARILSSEFGLAGRIDMTHPFVKIADRILNKQGILALLCSNRILTTLAGKNVRQVFLRGGIRTCEIYDLGDTRLFKASVLPAIIIGKKSSSSPRKVRFMSAYATESDDEVSSKSLFDALIDNQSSLLSLHDRHYRIRYGKFIEPVDETIPWRISDDASDKWLDTIHTKMWKTFGDVSNIRVGIKTTADNVFLNEDWDGSAPDVEKELLMPIIMPKDIRSWHVNHHPRMKVLYPYDMTSEKRVPLDIDAYDGAKQYLMSHKQQLAGRKYVTSGGREWWEIWVPQRPAAWSHPKIVFPDISAYPRFALDISGAVVNGNCYWISLDETTDENVLYLMLAVANSDIGLQYYDTVCGNRLYSGKRRWITQYVNRLPLPSPYTTEAMNVIDDAKKISISDDHEPSLIRKMNEDVKSAFSLA
jgi:predicted RNA methylase